MPQDNEAQSIEESIREWMDAGLSTDGDLTFWDAQHIDPSGLQNWFKIEIRFSGSRQASVGSTNPRVEWTGIVFVKCVTQKDQGTKLATQMADKARNFVIASKGDVLVNGITWRVPEIVDGPSDAHTYQKTVQCPFVVSTSMFAAA